MLILVVYFLFSLRGNRRAQWQKWEEAQGRFFPSDKAARTLQRAGEAEGALFPMENHRAQWLQGKCRELYEKQRGRSPKGVPVGDLPLSSLEGDVGLARPVGVDGYTGDGKRDLRAT